MAIAPIVLPKGNYFGSENNDEFSIIVDGKKFGVFKAFEYLSLPFTITGNQEKFKELIKKAEQNKTSFKDELEKDISAQTIVDNVFEQMDVNPSLTKQTLDMLLSKVYVNDNILATIETGNEFEDHISKIVLGWKYMADFFCIEGLVGGGSKNNPFIKKENSSFIAGGLDSLESVLPILKKKTNETKWKEICLKLSSIIGRDYQQINNAVDVLGKVFGDEKEFSEEELQNSLKIADELTQSRFETNKEIGKFYNTLIRFHNWMPLALKNNGLKGETYDSICVPTKRALNLLEDKKLFQEISKIKDATSPKGLALAMLTDKGKIGNKPKLIEKIQNLEKRLEEEITQKGKKFAILTLDDPAFYTGLVGGKWRGLKLLHDSKKAFSMNYEIPKGFVLSSIDITEKLDKSDITGIIYSNIFSLDKKRQQEIIRKIGNINFNYLDDFTANLGNQLVVRSSMYGEDGNSNFSGTYESVQCEKENIKEAVKKVIKSYFSQEAVKSREDIGLAHIPGISIIIQERIYGKGGIIYLTNQDYSLSFAETPEEAVLGNGTHHASNNIEDIVAGTSLEKVKQDLHNLHNLFGDSDIEFVINKNKIPYFIQLRPKYKIAKRAQINLDAERFVTNNMDELQNIKLNQKYIIRMSFLGRENIMHQEGEIMDFIRKNKKYIIAIEGKMPSVAHIPNKIEGHFRIPYIHYKGEEK